MARISFQKNLIPLVILNALEGKPLPIYRDCQQVRDWLHVEDHCEALALVLNRALPGKSYNIGGGNQPTNLTIVEPICDILDELLPDSKHKPHRQLIYFVKDRPGHDRRYAMSIQKIKQELGWQPRHNLVQGLHDTVAWYLAQTDWVSAIHTQEDHQT